MTAEPPPRLATHVITRLIVGGAQENTIATVLGLQDRPGLRCDLISGPTTGSEGTLEGEFRNREELLRVVPSLIRPVRPLADWMALRALRKIFREKKPTIVHTHSGKAGILGRWAAHLERVPIVVHGVHGPSFGPWQGATANAIFLNAERFAGRMTTHFVAVAEAMIEQYLAAGIGRREQYTRIFSGFPIQPYLAAENEAGTRARYGLKPEHLVVGKIARITHLKGHDDLLAVAAELAGRFPKIRFLLVGGAQLEGEFRAQVRALGLSDYFVFTGLVPPSEIPALAGIMDLLVHLSLREGLPRALPQALAAGKPVVAYDCDGAREVCITGETGILVPARDRVALAEALSTLARDGALRDRLGANGRKFAAERFPVEKMVEETYALYGRLLRARNLG